MDILLTRIALRKSVVLSRCAWTSRDKSSTCRALQIQIGSCDISLELALSVRGKREGDQENYVSRFAIYFDLQRMFNSIFRGFFELIKQLSLTANDPLRFVSHECLAAAVACGGCIHVLGAAFGTKGNNGSGRG